jgi:chromosome segregation protein
MVLRKLSIFGFKSFADKTEIHFGEGMTAVIGPNGCGKSNVIDAIRWVFGEQKASTLRSANMQDVIFSGTQKRQPLNLAEVTITIENSKHILPTEYSDVAITRRIFRSGDSEYCINRVPCRLRDIHNLFLDTGIGNSAYTTIENSMINSILSDKAEERRILFEEAAGIGKYKEKRRDSLRQLDRTRQDLLRINDKVQEADRQVRMLARHVEKANRYKSYFDDLKSLELGMENKRYTSFNDAIIKRKEELSVAETERTGLKSKIATSEASIEKMQLMALEKEHELDAAAKDVAAANDKIIALDRDISVSRERGGFSAENIARCERELLSLTEQIESGVALKLQIEKAIIEHDSEHQQCGQKVSKAKEELAAVDSKVLEYRQNADRLAAEQIDIINETGEQRNVVSGLKTNLANGIERLDHDQREIATLELRVDEYQEAIEASKRQLIVEQEAHQNLSISRESLLARIEKEDEKYQGLVEREKRLEAQIDSSKAQLKFLEGLDAAFEGYESGVKALLTAKKPDVLGIVAELITVADEQTVGLIERVLGTSIQTVVFKTDAQLANAMSYLTTEKAGAASMVSLERLGKTTRRAQTAIEGATNLRSSVQTGADNAILADLLFCNLWATQTSDEALKLSLIHPMEVFIAKDGTICRENGVVIAGASKKQQAGLLQRKQHIEKLTVDIDKFRTEYDKIINEKEICIINRDEAKFALVEVDEKLNHGRRKQQEQETTIKHYDNEIKNVCSKIQTISEECGRTKARMAEIESKILEGEALLEGLVVRRSHLEELVEKSKSLLVEMQKERNVHADHCKNIELEMLGLNNRMNQEKADVERLTNNIKAFAQKKEKITEEKRRAQIDVADIETGMESKLQSLRDLQEKRLQLESVRDKVREEYAGMQLNLDDLRKAVRVDQTLLEQISNKIHGREIEQTTADQEKRRIRERMWQAYEIDLESPPEGLPVIDDEDASVMENINMFKERLKRLGQVNMAALADFETENARLIEFTTQRDDLQKAVDELDKAIKKLDKEARMQFIATFEQVQKNFVSMFTTLFEGGEAHVTLEENVDPLEAAININVRPGGKKMRGVSLLSGGERALTAISLLFALYLVKPSAYCILDELDAPLDDANIGRFVNILRKFAERTQFIVVTHNKRTMEAADLLYGVTQQESGVSTIVSVKVEEVALKAA